MRVSDVKEGGTMQNQMHNGLTKNDMIQQGFVTMWVHFSRPVFSRLTFV